MPFNCALPRIATGMVVMVALAGCGGGGGSGGGTAAPAASGTVFSLQGASSTVAYPASSAAASFNGTTILSSGVAPSSAGSTVTVMLDSGGSLSSVAINVTSGGAVFGATYPMALISGSQTTPLTLGQLALRLELLSAAPTGTTNFAFQGLTTGLNSMAFGVWAANDGPGVGRVGQLAFGVATPVMPVTGTATYLGSTLGVAGNGVNSAAFTGTAQVTANFATNVVGTTFSGLIAQDLVTNTLAALPTLTGTGSIVGNAYSTAISGGVLTGIVNGTFYGTGSPETGGVWRATGGGVTLIGSYGARQ